MITTGLFLLPALAFLSCATLHAQVLIGGTDRPKNGAILDLNSTAKGGLILSNVTITDPEKIPFNSPNVFPGINASNADVNLALRGAMVYNSGLDPALPAGIYVWNGYSWTQDGACVLSIISTSSTSVTASAGKSVILSITATCAERYQWYSNSVPSNTDGNSISDTNAASYKTPGLSQGTHYYYCKASSSSGEVTSDVFTVNVLASGSGSFSGNTCFDLAQGNDDLNGCGPVSGRKPTVFSDRDPQDNAGTAPVHYSGVQVYTFTPTGTVSRVRFGYTETSGISVERIEPESTAYATSDGINYACRVTVYYREDLDDELKGTTRDTGHKLKLYAIYNSESAYLTPSNDKILELNISLQDCACCGAYVSRSPDRWLNFMCHNLGADEGANPFTPDAAIHGAKYKWGTTAPAVTQEEDQDPAFIGTTYYPNWGSTCCASSNSTKWIDSPCPDGWRIPTKEELDGVINSSNNVLTYVSGSSYTSGLRIGSVLFLPSNGNRNGTNTSFPGRIEHLGTNGFYWNDSPITTRYFLYQQGSVRTFTQTLHQSFGISVRCVAE